MPGTEQAHICANEEISQQQQLWLGQWGGQGRDLRRGEETAVPAPGLVGGALGSWLEVVASPTWTRSSPPRLIYIVQDREDKVPALVRFGKELEKAFTPDCFPYRQSNDFPPNFEWNLSSSPDNAAFFNQLPTVDIALPWETPFSGNPETPMTVEKCLAQGRAFVNAFKNYLKNG